MYEPSGAVVDELAVHRAPVQGDVYRCHSCDTELVAGVDSIVEGPYGEAFCPGCALKLAAAIQTEMADSRALGLSRGDRRRLTKASHRRNDGRAKGTSVKKKPKKSTKKGY